MANDRHRKPGALKAIFPCFSYYLLYLSLTEVFSGQKQSRVVYDILKEASTHVLRL